MAPKRSSKYQTTSERKAKKLKMVTSSENFCLNGNLEKMVNFLETIKEKKLLHEASKNGNTKIVDQLLKYEFGINDINERNDDGKAPLHLASENGHVEIVAKLLENGAKVNLLVGDFEDDDWHSRRSLHLASEHGHLEVVKILLKYGANFTVVDDDNYNPLQYACMKGIYSFSGSTFIKIDFT